MTIDTNTISYASTDLQADQLLHIPNSKQCRTLAHMCPRPIPNSYWATPLLLACEYPYAPRLKSQKLDALLSSGIRTFIDLTEHGELSPYAPHLDKRAAQLGIDVSTVEYHCFPIQDRSLPQSVEYMCQILDVLRDNERRGRISAVHCRGGIGRTGMVIGCWLVECEVARNGEEALAVIAKEWKTVEKCKRFPHSPETGPQFEFVKNFRRCRRAYVAFEGCLEVVCHFLRHSVYHNLGQNLMPPQDSVELFSRNDYDRIPGQQLNP